MIRIGFIRRVGIAQMPRAELPEPQLALTQGEGAIRALATDRVAPRARFVPVLLLILVGGFAAPFFLILWQESGGPRAPAVLVDVVSYGGTIAALAAAGALYWLVGRIFVTARPRS